MNRQGNVFYNNKLCGIISETDDGYTFEYTDSWLSKKNALPVSQTMPLSQKIYKSKTFFPFFDGLIPEGWLLEIAVKNWKLDPRDRMGLLLAVCRDCIGAVSIR